MTVFLGLACEQIFFLNGILKWHLKIIMVIKESSQLLIAKFHNCRVCDEVEKYIKFS